MKTGNYRIISDVPGGVATMLLLLRHARRQGFGRRGRTLQGSARYSAILRNPIIHFFYFLLFTFNFSQAQQNTDNLYRKPLSEVLSDIQKKFGVQIKYAY